jgi:atypical dual specificity phosphatase
VRAKVNSISKHDEKEGDCMLNGFFWLIEGEIAGMAMPNASRAYLYLEDADAVAMEEMRLEIEELQKRGIGAVTTLTEASLPKRPFEEAKIAYQHLPVPDMTAPTPSQIEDFIAFARENIEADKAVVTHCLAGAGRTGTMLACYLVHKGMEPDQAIMEVRRKRPGAIETRWQEEAVFLYADQNARSG